MLQTIITSLAGLISFMIMDYVWLAHIAKDTYLKSLGAHIATKNDSLVVNMTAVPFVYLVAILAISVFALPKATTLLGAFVFGVLLGFVMYTFYNLTNVATFKEYPWSIALVDIIWGAFITGTVTAIMFFAQSKYEMWTKVFE